MLLPLLPLVAAMSAEAQPVSVQLYDVNHDETVTVQIGRDGSVSRHDKIVLKHVFRCKRTERQHMINQRTLAMFADVVDHWRGHTVEIVSGYRAMRRESRTSPHRAARAIDFRIRGVSTIPVRDYLWTKFHTVGVGWYPSGRYLHLDYRPGLHDTAWTFRHGKNDYRPSWAEQLRPNYQDEPRAVVRATSSAASSRRSSAGASSPAKAKAGRSRACAGHRRGHRGRSCSP